MRDVLFFVGMSVLVLGGAFLLERCARPACPPGYAAYQGGCLG